MSPRFLAGKLLFLALLAGAVGGCSRPKPTVDKVISEMIRGGLAARAQVINGSDAVFSDYDVYRDGGKNGVVFQYTFQAGLEIEPSNFDIATIKKEMVTVLAANPDTAKCLGFGVYIRYIHQTSRGEVISDIRITSADLK